MRSSLGDSTEPITSSSAMAERPCKLDNFKGWVTLRLNFRLNGYVLRKYLWTLDRGVVML